MTTQIEPVDRAAIAQIVIDELQANPQRLLPDALVRLPQDFAELAQTVAELTQAVAVLVPTVATLVQTVDVLAHKIDALEQGQQAIIAEQQVLAEGQRAIVAEQRAIVAEQRAIVAEQQVLAEGQRAIVAEQQAIIAEQQVLAEGQRAIVAEQRAIVAEQQVLAEGQRAIVAEQQAIVAEQQVLAEGQRAIVAEQQVLAEGQRAIVAEQQAMAARMSRIENDLGSVKGWGLELLCARRPGMIGRRLNMSRVRTVDPGEVAEMADDARDSGIITSAEHDQLIVADVVYRGVRDSDRTPCYAVLEVSYVVDINDVRRATARADLLSRITGTDAVCAVAGDRITEGARAVAETHGGVSDVDGDGVIYIHVQNGAQLRS